MELTFPYNIDVIAFAYKIADGGADDFENIKRQAIKRVNKLYKYLNK